MSLFEFSRTTDAILATPFGTRDGTVTMAQPVRFDDKSKKAYQIQNVTLSGEIPNIFSYGTFNNTLLRISNDGGANWTIVQFANGIYQINMIQDNITNAFLQAGWITDATKTPLIVSYNPATQLIYVILDSSQLIGVGAQVGVDFGFSSMYVMLGFDSAASGLFDSDGTFGAQLPPQIDVQGTFINVAISLIQYARNVNGVFSNVVAKVPIVSGTTTNEIVFPSGSTGNINTPFIEASIPAYVMSYSVSFTTQFGNPVVWLYGNAVVQFVIKDV